MGKTFTIAHRGGAALKPENTLAAFAAAIACGCDGAELDVQLSADGVAVVHHDWRLNPAITRHAGVWLSGETPLIKDLSFAALQAFDIGRPDPGSNYARARPKMAVVEGEHIPTLEAVLALTRKSRAPFTLFVELKSSMEADAGDPITLAEETLSVMEANLDQTIFVGFDWRGLLRIKALATDARCWFTTDKLEGDLEPLLDAIAGLKADGWFPDHRDITAETVAHARSLGLKVGAWTVNQPAEMKRLVALGLDAICTDRPDLLQALE